MRPVVIGLFRREHRVLVAAVTDDDGTVKGWRPLGGGINFGERAEDALVREMDEELGAKITDLRCLGVIENLFEHAGQTGHEIVFVFGAEFSDPGLALSEGFVLEDQSFRSRAEWRETLDFTSGTCRLLPDGLIDYL